MKRTTKSQFIILASLLTGGLFVPLTSQVSAHGYVETPPARGYQGKLDATTLGWTDAFNLYGNVITNPQSLEAPKGFPESGPANGRIASANGGFGQINDFVLDNQSSQRWKKSTLTTGPNTFNWHYTAKHRTSQWHYYLTKPGWDQNAPLTRDTMERIGTISHDTSMPSDNDPHIITIPQNRQGYHVMLAVWDVYDTANAFYNVIDLDIKNNGNLPVLPATPEHVRSTNTTKESASLTWEGQATAKSYHVYRDNKRIATVATNQFTDTGLKADTTYTYTIQALSHTGQLSEKSQPYSVTTLAESALEKPTPPKHLHSMGETSDSLSLMWGKSTHTDGISHYLIYRNNEVIGSTTKTSYTDTQLRPSTTYHYHIQSISTTNITSDKSNQLTLSTKPPMSPETEKPTPPETPTPPAGERVFKLGTFQKPILYNAKDIVRHNDKRYLVLTTHQNYGDPNWAPDIAQSLFQLN